MKALPSNTQYSDFQRLFEKKVTSDALKSF